MSATGLDDHIKHEYVLCQKPFLGDQMSHYHDHDQKQVDPVQGTRRSFTSLNHEQT